MKIKAKLYLYILLLQQRSNIFISTQMCQNETTNCLKSLLNDNIHPHQWGWKVWKFADLPSWDEKHLKKNSEVNPLFDETVEVATTTQLLSALDNLRTFSFHAPHFFWFYLIYWNGLCYLLPLLSLSFQNKDIMKLLSFTLIWSMHIQSKEHCLFVCFFTSSRSTLYKALSRTYLSW